MLDGAIYANIKPTMPHTKILALQSILLIACFVFVVSTHSDSHDSAILTNHTTMSQPQYFNYEGFGERAKVEIGYSQAVRIGDLAAFAYC